MTLEISSLPEYEIKGIFLLVFTGNQQISLAAFQVINRLSGMDVTLTNFSLNAVTDGEDAIGEAVVKLENGNGETFTGTGLSTDIIESSIRAYVNAVNKIVYEEG